MKMPCQTWSIALGNSPKLPRPFRAVLFAATALFASNMAGQAQVLLLQHDFNGSTTATTVGSTVQSSVFDSSHLTSFTLDDDGFGPVLQAYPSAGSTSSSAALANDSYWSLTVTANPGETLDIGSVFYSVGKGGAADPRGYFIRSSVDGFTSDLAGATLTSGAQQAPQAFSVDVSGNPGYQGLSSIEMRFYNFTPTPTGNSVDWRNVGLQAVPEPSSYATVFGLACAGVGFWRRRRLQTGA